MTVILDWLCSDCGEGGSVEVNTDGMDCFQEAAEVIFQAEKSHQKNSPGCSSSISLPIDQADPEAISVIKRVYETINPDSLFLRPPLDSVEKHSIAEL